MADSQKKSMGIVGLAVASVAFGGIWLGVKLGNEPQPVAAAPTDPTLYHFFHDDGWSGTLIDENAVVGWKTASSESKFSAVLFQRVQDPGATSKFAMMVSGYTGEFDYAVGSLEGEWGYDVAKIDGNKLKPTSNGSGPGKWEPVPDPNEDGLFSIDELIGASAGGDYTSEFGDSLIESQFCVMAQVGCGGVVKCGTCSTDGTQKGRTSKGGGKIDSCCVEGEQAPEPPGPPQPGTTDVGPPLECVNPDCSGGPEFPAAEEIGEIVKVEKRGGYDGTDGAEDGGEGCASSALSNGVGEEEEDQGLGYWNHGGNFITFAEASGLGLHVHIPTGNVYAKHDLGPGVTVQYNHMDRGTESTLGKGWTDGNNLYLDTEAIVGAILVVDGSGYESAYTSNGVGFDRPVMRDADLVFVGNQYELRYRDGGRVRFNIAPTTPGGSIHHVAEFENQHGSITRFDYLLSRLSKITTAHGLEIDYNYNAEGRITSIDHTNGESTSFVYSEDKLVGICDDAGCLEFGYTGDLLTSEMLRNGVTFTCSYTPRSREIKDSLGGAIVRVDAPRFPDFRNDHINTWNSVGYLPTNTVQVTDGRGEVLHRVRNQFGRSVAIKRPISQWSAVTLFQMTYAADGEGRITWMKNGVGATQTLEYDSLDRLSLRTDEMGVETAYAYWNDPSVRRYMNISSVTRSIGGDESIWSADYFGANGRLKGITDPVGNSISYTYTFHAQGPNNLPGRVKEVERTDRLGNRTKREYSELGQLIIHTIDPGGLNLVREYSYGKFHHLLTSIETRVTPTKTLTTILDYDDALRWNGLTIDPVVSSESLNLTYSWTMDGQGKTESFTDAKGTTTAYERDHRGRIETITHDPAGLNLRAAYAYDDADLLISYTDPNGGVSHYDYNEYGHLVFVRDAENLNTRFVTNTLGLVTTRNRWHQPGSVAGPGHRTTYAYDNANRIRSISVLGSGTTYVEYTDSGACTPCGAAYRPLVRKITDGEGKISFFEYDDLDRLTKAIRKINDVADNGGDADDAVWVFSYDAEGNLLSRMSPEGETVAYLYDAANRPYQRAVDSLGNNLVTTVSYDGASNPEFITLPTGNVITLTYDMANRPEAVVDSIGDLVSLTYDANDNVESYVDANGNAWSFNYDAADRLVKAYDPLVESPADAFTTYLYDLNSNLTGFVDRNGVQARFEYDGIDRMTRMVEDFVGTPGSGTENTATSFSYNGLGDITFLTDHDNNVTEYVYDSAGRVERIKYPDNNPPGSGELAFEYNLVDRVTKRTDQSGVETTYTYDDLHQLTGRSYSTLRDETFAFDRSGRLKLAQNDLARLEFAHDPMGRLDSLQQIFLTDVAQYTTDFGYSVGPVGATRTIDYPAGRAVVDTFDERLRMIDVSGGAGVGASWQYDDANRRIGAALANGVSSTFGFDVNDRVTAITHTGTAPIFDVQYGFGPAGNRLFTKNLLQSDRSELYGHDSLYRLRSLSRGVLNANNDAITTPLVHPALATAKQWTNLDHRGNWLDVSATINSVTTQQTRTPNGVNEYESIDPDGPDPQPAVALVHDANGNLTLDPLALNVGDAGAPSGQKYEYDEENRVTVVRRASDDAVLLEKRYDAVGRRVESIDHQDAHELCGVGQSTRTRHLYVGPETIEEYTLCDDGTGGIDTTLAREFIWGTSFPEPVALIDHTDAGVSPVGTPEVLHYVHDILGSVIALTDAAGAAVENYTYEAYGQTHITDATGTGLTESAYANPFAWTGQRYDAAVNLYHFWFRTYSPTLGRWLGRDPIGYVDGPSLYAYVSGGPLGATDSFGLVLDFVLDAIGAVSDGFDYVSGGYTQIGFIIGVEGISYGEAVAAGDQMQGAVINGGLDIAAAAIPGMIGPGGIKVAGKAADAIADAAKAADNAADAAKAAKKAAEAAKKAAEAAKKAAEAAEAAKRVKKARKKQKAPGQQFEEIEGAQRKSRKGRRPGTIIEQKGKSKQQDRIDINRQGKECESGGGG